MSAWETVGRARLDLARPTEPTSLLLVERRRSLEHSRAPLSRSSSSKGLQKFNFNAISAHAATSTDLAASGRATRRYFFARQGGRRDDISSLLLLPLHHELIGLLLKPRTARPKGSSQAEDEDPKPPASHPRQGQRKYQTSVQLHSLTRHRSHSASAQLRYQSECRSVYATSQRVARLACQAHANLQQAQVAPTAAAAAAAVVALTRNGSERLSAYLESTEVAERIQADWTLHAIGEAPAAAAVEEEPLPHRRARPMQAEQCVYLQRKRINSSRTMSMAQQCRRIGISESAQAGHQLLQPAAPRRVRMRTTAAPRPLLHLLQRHQRGNHRHCKCSVVEAEVIAEAAVIPR